MRKALLAILFFSILLAPQVLSAQSAPSFKRAPEITEGSMPNGIKYYLVRNSSDKGNANMALVQKNQTDAAALAGALAELADFPAHAPYRLLGDGGVGYGPDGYVSWLPEAAVVRFDGVPFYDTAVADSVTLMMFDLMKTSPGDQALIISGDIDVAKLSERLYLLSLSVPARSGAAPEEAYQWRSSEFIRARFTQNKTSGFCTIGASYDYPRLSAEEAAAGVATVSRTYADMLGIILGKRLRDAFYEKGIPMAGAGSLYKESARTSGDERFSFCVNTPVQYAMPAAGLFAQVLASLDSQGATLQEITDARSQIQAAALKESVTPLDNAGYIEKCISAYLRGGDLASPADRYEYFSKRRLQPRQDLSFFNSFVSDIIDPAANLTVSVDVPGDYSHLQDSICTAFRSTLAEPTSLLAGRDKSAAADTVRLARTAKRVKPRGQDTPDPVTGGVYINFPGDFRVLYKKSDAVKGRFEYAFLLNGGLESIPGITPGEAPFVGDMPGLYSVAGRSPRQFADMLCANGISMSSELSLSDFRITGDAPSDKLELLVKSLVAFATDRRPDAEAYSYYRKCEALRLQLAAGTQEAFRDLMLDTMSPGAPYLYSRDPLALSDDLPSRVETYLAGQFAKCNDGLLVIIGDVEEARLKTIMGQYAANFTTSGRTSLRAVNPLAVSTVSTTKTADLATMATGNGLPSAHVAVSVPLPYSIDNSAAAAIAFSAVARQIRSALADAGMYCTVTTRTEQVPAERYILLVDCYPCAADGLPEGVEVAAPDEVLFLLGTAISSVRVPDAATVKALREHFLASMDAAQKQPSALVEEALLRNSLGKDIVSSYKERINSVNVNAVSRVLDMVRESPRAEYIVR